jgi:glycine oxidase
MPGNNIDTLIIGGGIIGLLTARELALAGQSVTVLERNPRAGLESSWAGGGILSPLYPWRYPDAVTDLSAIGHLEYPRLAAELLEATGIDPEYIRSGQLILDTEEQDEAKSWAKEFSKKISLDSKTRYLSRIGRREMSVLEPELSENFHAALWLPYVGQVRNPRIMKSLIQDLTQRGVKIITDMPVEKINTSAGKVVNVETPAGKWSAGKYLVAAGAWSATLLEDTGLTLNIEPVRGQMILFKTEPGRLNRIIMNNGKYIIPRKDGHIVAGSTLEYVGFDKSTTDDACHLLMSEAVSIVPFLAKTPVVSQWAGLRPGSADGTPTIDWHPQLDNLVICSGHFRNGVIIGLGSARIAASLLQYRSLKHASSSSTNPYKIK